MKGLPKKGGWVVITDIIQTVIPVHKFAIYYAYPTGMYFIEGERHVANDMRAIGGPSTDAEWILDDLIRVFGNRNNTLKAVYHYCRSNPNYEYTSSEKEALGKVGSDTLESMFKIVQQVKIRTEHGDVVVMPEEYNIVDEKRLQEYMQSVNDGHGFIVYLSKSQQLKGKIADQVFYLRSRGISFTKALELCIGEVRTNNLFYMYMHPYYVAHYTREPLLTNYFNRHLNSMLESGLDELMTDYLTQIKQIEGYHDFEPKLKDTKVEKTEE